MSPPVEPPPLAALPGHPSAGDVLDRFAAVAASRGLELYPEQEEAILELYSGSSVILATPTGSGKSLVAAAFHYKALCDGIRSVYTCPIKALVNEKFLSLCRDFGPDKVGMMTGDATVNPDAPVLCCTAEILANRALAEGERCDLRAVVMDEFHYYSDPERGHAWQVPLLTLGRARFLLMSATLGSTVFFEGAISRLTGAPCKTVRSDRRPVPLEFEYSQTPLAERVGQLLLEGKAPVYLVHFTQRSAAEAAQNLMSLDVCSREEKAILAKELERARFTSPYGKEIKRWLRHGIGVHHAGLLPKYRILVEGLAQKGLLKLICGTDTLGVGINVPIRSVLFTQLWKYDGQKSAILSVRDFRQIAGRAGRRGFDEKGFVVVQAPEHVIANKRAEEKAAKDGKQRKIAKQRPPEGSVSWDEKTFERLQVAPAEELRSRFRVSHGMLLLVLGREGDGCRAMRRILCDCHESASSRRALKRRAWQLYQALLSRGIVARQEGGRRLRVNVDLQEDFSLHHALSLFLIDTLAALDPQSEDYPFNVLTLCESIIEDPEQILLRQADRLKTEKLEEMKQEGVPYEERMEKLEAIEHPKPLAEFIYERFNAFVVTHPWAEGETVRPKSVAREMYERYLSFADYIRAYELQRSEGLLLRHLSQVWKVLAQTVPDGAKTEQVLEMEDYLRELVRGIDSSLLEEWERMSHPEFEARESPDKPARPSTFDITRDAAAFKRLVRAAIFGFLQDVLAQEWESAISRLATGEARILAEGETLGDEARRLSAGFSAYFEARGRFRLDPDGRSAGRTFFREDAGQGLWAVSQVLVDGAAMNDWAVEFEVDLKASRTGSRAHVKFLSISPIGS